MWPGQVSPKSITHSCRQCSDPKPQEAQPQIHHSQLQAVQRSQFGTSPSKAGSHGTYWSLLGLSATASWAAATGLLLKEPPLSICLRTLNSVAASRIRLNLTQKAWISSSSSAMLMTRCRMRLCRNTHTNRTRRFCKNMSCMYAVSAQQKHDTVDAEHVC